MDILKFSSSEFTASAQLLQRCAVDLAESVARVGDMLVERILAGNKLLVFGNGGSAADAQHFAAELGGRFRRERRGLPALALTTDTSLLTAVGNDYGFDRVFARQVAAMARPGDVVIGISTSGRSPNVLAGLQTARQFGATTVALVGANTSEVAPLSDFVIPVPASDAPRVQEVHAVVIHILCDIVEQAVCRAEEV
jgi:D-sedoheptulose 7-phosphate isomerase